MAHVYTPDELRQLHEIEKSILSEIIRVCEENNITYFVDWGTLLGTIRHGGFIPWDDDVDISMPRRDYNKFLQIAPEKLKKEFTLQHYNVDKNTPTYQAKVRKDNTLFVENYLNKLDTHKGIFVDIFPYDKVPENSEERRQYEKKCWSLRRVFVSKDVAETTTVRDKYKKIVYGFARNVMHVLLMPVSKDTLFRNLDLQYRKYDGTKTDVIECCANVPLRKSDIFPLKKATFDELTVNIPNDADKVLKAEYGDYMKLPPEDERVGHAPDILSFDTSQEDR